MTSAGCRSDRNLCGNLESNELRVKLIIYNYDCHFIIQNQDGQSAPPSQYLWTWQGGCQVQTRLSFIIQNHLLKSKLVYHLSLIIQNHLFKYKLIHHSSFKTTSSKPILVDVAGWTSSPNSSASARVSVVWTITLNSSWGW